MKLSCRLLILALLSGLMAAAIAQPTNNQVPQKEISAVSKDEAAKQVTAAKLERIRIPEFNVEHLGLGEVLHRLNTIAKQYDPEKNGVVIMVGTEALITNLSLEISYQTGLPLTAENIEKLTDLQITNILIGFPKVMRDSRLADVVNTIISSANTPIYYDIEGDGTIVFHAGVRLTMRTFAVDVKTLEAMMQCSIADLDSTNYSKRLILSKNCIKYFESVGVNIESPSGKSVFYNDRQGKLFINATERDLDAIEKSIIKLQAIQPSSSQ